MKIDHARSVIGGVGLFLLFVSVVGSVACITLQSFVLLPASLLAALGSSLVLMINRRGRSQ